MEESVSRSKLIPPLRNLNGTIQRSSFESWKKEIDRVKVVSLQAPAGYGKTTAALQLLQDRPEGIRWLSIAPPLTSRGSFWRCVIEVFAEDIPDKKDSLIDRFATAPGKAEAAVISLCNALQSVSRPLDFVVDDYHLLEGNTDQEMELFLDNLPPALRIWILSRGHESLALARFSMRGELFELEPADLLFRSEDSTKLLQTINRKLTEENCRKIEEQIGGWAAGLRTIGMVISDAADPDLLLKNLLKRKNKVVSYLTEDILGSLDPDVREMVQRTVFLVQFTPAMASRLLKEKTESWCAKELSLLEDRGFFINITGTDNYAYQHFFRDLLKQYIINNNDRYLEIVDQCAVMMLDEGQAEEAALMAREFQLTERLAKILAVHYGLWLASGRYADFLELIRDFPESLMDAHPPLKGLRIWSRSLQQDDIDYDNYFRLDFTDEVDRGLCAAAKTYSAFYILGDSKEMETCSREIEHLLQNRFPEVTSIISFLSISTLQWLGKPGEACEALGSMDREILYETAPYFGVLMDLNLGFAQTDMMMVEETLALYEDTKRRIRTAYHTEDIPFWDLGWGHEILLKSWSKSDPSLLHEAKKAQLLTEELRSDELIFLFHLFVAEAAAPISIEDAYYHLDRCLYHVGKSRWGRKFVLAAAVKLALWFESPAEARRWEAQMDAVDHKGDLGWYIESVTKCWSAWGRGKTEKAEKLIDELLTGISIPPIYETELRILKARIRDDRESLMKILTDCDNKGMGEWARIRAGIEKGAARISETDKTPDVRHYHSLSDEEIRGLIDEEKRVTIRGFEERFTGRELQILHLMARGATNNDIADTIYISINTVRWYGRQLFAKLDVRRRGEAARAARELGLLD